jgi:hypothetical protein
MVLIQCHFDYFCSSGMSQGFTFQVTQDKTVGFLKGMDPITSIKQTELSSLAF